MHSIKLLTSIWSINYTHKRLKRKNVITPTLLHKIITLIKKANFKIKILKIWQRILPTLNTRKLKGAIVPRELYFASVKISEGFVGYIRGPLDKLKSIINYI